MPRRRPMQPSCSSKLAAEVDSMVSESQQASDGYTLKGEIGRGGFGVVYSAVQEATGETVVVKEVALVPMKKQALDLVLGEVRLMQSLRHANVVRYIDAFITRGHSSTAGGDSLHIVMEYMALFRSTSTV